MTHGTLLPCPVTDEITRDELEAYSRLDMASLADDMTEEEMERGGIGDSLESDQYSGTIRDTQGHSILRIA